MLDTYISNYKDKLTRSIYDEYINFDYDNYDHFKIDVDFLLQIYNIKLYEPKQIRSKQDEFRDNLIERDKKCIISNTDACVCEAAHIIPNSEEENYDIDNGLLLDSGLHKCFDKYFWCINPETLTVELHKDLKIENIPCVKFKNNKININPNNKMLENIKERYKRFLSYKF